MAQQVELAAVVPVKGMCYGPLRSVTTRGMDTAIIDTLKGAYTDGNITKLEDISLVKA